MGHNLTEQLLLAHLVEGALEPGGEIGIRVDQTLTQDATGTMAFLQFEAIGLDRVRPEVSVSYIDHNTLQNGFENADDHRFLQSAAAKFGVRFSRPGNGICHQVHLERFAEPGKTLVGSDSHTPTAGGVGAFAMGAGGIDVAMAMGGSPFYLRVPRVVNVRLRGALPPWVGAKDVILEVLRRVTVRGGVGSVLEYGGDGVASLSIPERGTIANMGAETGATTSIFPSDQVTRAFLQSQGRGECWVELSAEPGSVYDEIIEIDLSTLEPLVARPHSPDNVVKVSELEGLAVDQVVIGSCTNSSYEDLMRVAAILKGKTVHPRVSLAIAPGTRQVLRQLASNGALDDILGAGARLLEAACGPCVGVGQAPPSGGVSVRTTNRNFLGRSGTKDSKVYLVGPETAAITAVNGVLSDPRGLGPMPEVQAPDNLHADDSMILLPAASGRDVTLVRGPNIKPCPVGVPIEGDVAGEVLLKVGDNISTDEIMPAGSAVLPLRSNVPAISRYVFKPLDPTFAARADEAKGGFVVAGHTYGQGSSREHAALAPMYLGVRAVIAKSFARIHRDNLVNFGILPIVFLDPGDYERVDQGDRLLLVGVLEALGSGGPLIVRNLRNGADAGARIDVTPRQAEVIKVGGLLRSVS
jgi:aconitate hydratase